MSHNFYVYYDLVRELKGTDLDLIFEGWNEGDERVAILSPHDDDALLGAGYLLLATIYEGGKPFVLIFCDGSGGYSTVDEKERIVSVRRVESTRAYEKLGIRGENIVRFDYPDFGLKPYIGWNLPGGFEGTTARVIGALREIRPTRLLIPNDYREHMDHEALSYIGLYDGPQAGDPVIANMGEPFRIRSYLKYSVWGDFSPEDALSTGRNPSLRGNVAVKVKEESEVKVLQALGEFKSQEKIIAHLVKSRLQRTVGSGYIEAYLKFNPRPSMNYAAYMKKVLEIDENNP